MEIIDKGHHYRLATLDGIVDVKLLFVKRFRGGDNHAGTTCQEVLRVLIDRTKELDKEKPWELNADIIKHLRMALVLYEARALIRSVEKGELEPEKVEVSPHDGHFHLTEG